MTPVFEKTSWRWQLEQTQQQLGEWIEVKLRSVDRDPQFDPFPSWLGVLLVRLTWVVLAALLLWFGYKIIYPYWQQWIAKNRQTKSIEFSTPVKTFTLTELLAKSQQFQQEGNYTQATRWLYLAVLQRLVEKGNTVMVIEHNMDVIKVGDYVIDMGAEGGHRGGEILVSGTPEKVAKTEGSHTGRFLKLEL